MKTLQFSLKRLFVITAIICVYMAIVRFIFNVFTTSPVRFTVWWLLGWIHVIVVGVAVVWIITDTKYDDTLLMRLLLILLAIFVWALFL